MKLITRIIAGIILLTSGLTAFAANRINLMIAPATLTSGSSTLLWDKQSGSAPVVYEILLNGKVSGSTSRTNYTIDGLMPETWYTVSVRISRQKSVAGNIDSIKFKTPSRSKIHNVLDFGAKGDSLTKNTKAIQAAIDACEEGGTVTIPKGVFLSGALYLKSNMILNIEKGAVLKGSVDVDDYLPMLLNRFEGWEMKTYASLLNAGTLNRDGSYNVKNLRITGGGTISGGGRRLGEAMTKASGIRSRGRLILLMNCQNVCLSNLTITEPPCWTIHYLYSNNVTCQNLNIITNNIHNGDGIDPDSSTDSYIFNCTFSTGDDCIAIKSGKNPEGFFVAKPTKNVRVTDCNFKKGHGISIGSEMSGGVSDVLVQDCKAGALLHGMQIKGTKDRGGYVRNVTVRDCQLLKITVYSAVNYNNDGEPAPEVPVFENYVFQNIDLSEGSVVEPVININGFKEAGHKLKNVRFINVKMPQNSTVLVNEAEKISFRNVSSSGGKKPVYKLNNTSDVVY